MGIFSFLTRSRKPRKQPPTPKTRLTLEPLEGRLLPCAISGYVYNDANNNGLFDPGEMPIANSQVELVNTSNQVVATATTNNLGYYVFTQDNTIPQGPQTQTQTLNFPTTATDFSLQQVLNQFDTSLGTLQSVTITESGSITSTIKVENTSPSSALVNATVAGTLSLSGPGVSAPLNLQQNAGTFNASGYDGALDFAGTSGISFPPQSASGTTQLTLTGAQMTGFEGAGTVTMTESGKATSSATGSGNLVVSLASTGQATVTVTYNYIPDNCFRNGNYTIELVQTPAGYTPGKESSNFVVLNVPPGTNAIPVTWTGTDLLNNDFGELLPSSLSGFVYVDANKNGMKDAGDNGLPGVQVTLSGTDSTGANVFQTAFTNPLGAYSFPSLRPGSYTLTASQPAGYIPGQDTAGSQGGIAGNSQISGISLAQNVQGINNNFGEILPSADLAVVKTAKQSQVQLGQEVDYTLTISNLGPNTAQNVLVTDNLPSGATYLTASGNGWAITQNNGVITATMNSLAVGAVSIIYVSIDAPLVPGNITNTVTVTSTTPDPNPNNNTSIVTTPVIDQPGKVLPKIIPPLVTTPAIVNKLQLIPGVTQYIPAGVVNRLVLVDGLFRTLEGRGATYSEQVTYANKLASGALTVTGLVNQLWASPAHLSIEARGLYQEILHRAPTAAELASTVASLKGGASDSSIMLGLLTSLEYQTKHPDAASFISGFYADVLGEIPSSLTQLTLVQAMGANTIQQEAQNLLASTDALNNIVINGFDNIMRRPPTATELQYWTGQLQAGVTQAAFQQQLLTSSQFQQLCIARMRH